MANENKIQKLIAYWPISVVALGILLTIVWIVIVAWFPLRLLFSA
jgi:hypothetical protein